jgi:copper chaperone CopZ
METYGIKGMTCEGCVKSITNALKAALGDRVKFEVSLAENCVKVEGAHDPQVVKQTIEDAGFDVQ